MGNVSVRSTSTVAALQAIIDDLDTGSTVRIYDGTPPADADAALSGNTLLAQLAMSATPFAAASDAGGSATATANAITDDSSADNTGTASFCRLYDNAGTCIIQGTVGLTSSGAFLELVGTTTITAGLSVSISSMTLTLPETAP